MITDEKLETAGYTPAQIAAVRKTGDDFFQVSVVRPCDCDQCTAGKRWFYCRNIATRQVAGYIVVRDGWPTTSDPVIKGIFRDHPGMELIF